MFWGKFWGHTLGYTEVLTSPLFVWWWLLIVFSSYIFGTASPVRQQSSPFASPPPPSDIIDPEGWFKWDAGPFLQNILNILMSEGCQNCPILWTNVFCWKWASCCTFSTFWNVLKAEISLWLVFAHCNNSCSKTWNLDFQFGKGFFSAKSDGSYLCY